MTGRKARKPLSPTIIKQLVIDVCNLWISKKPPRLYIREKSYALGVLANSRAKAETKKEHHLCSRDTAIAMGHMNRLAITLAILTTMVTADPVLLKNERLMYIYEAGPVPGYKHHVVCVNPQSSQRRNRIDRSEETQDKTLDQAREASKHNETVVVSRSDILEESLLGDDYNNHEYFGEAIDTGGESIVEHLGDNEDLFDHHQYEDAHNTVTLVKKVHVPYPVEKTIRYPVVKKILYPVKVPVPQPYAVEKEVPFPVKVYIKVPVRIPRPVPVIKEVPYPVHVPIDRPVPVNVFVPDPYPVEKKIHYEVKVPVPKPFPIERKIPVPVKVPVHVPQPYPVEKVIHYPVEIEVEKPVPVPVPKPYPVHISKLVPYPVEKPVAVPVRVLVHRPIPVPVDKPVPVKVKVPVPAPYPVEKEVPYPVEKPVPVPVKVPVERPFPVHVTKHVPYPVEKHVPYPVEVPVAVPVHEDCHEGYHVSSETHEVLVDHK